MCTGACTTEFPQGLRSREICKTAHDYFFSLSANADQPYRCGVSPGGSGDIVEYRVSISVSITLMMCLLVSPVLTASLTAFKTACTALRCSTVIGPPT